MRRRTGDARRPGDAMRHGERVRSLVAGVLNALGIATIPKRDLTVTRLDVTVARLKAYW